MAGKPRPLWRTMYREAHHAYRAAEKAFIALAGQGLRDEERYRRAGYHRACVLYTLVLEELEQGAPCRREDKVKLYKRAALAFACNRQPDMAWHCLERLLELRTRKNDEYYFLEGFLHLLAEDWEKALICYNQSLQLFNADNITTAMILGQKARALAATGRLQEAYGCIREAVRITPKHAALWESYMQIARGVKDKKEADRAEERMRSLLAQQK